MDKLIESDLYRATGKADIKSLLICLLKDPCFRFLFCWRKVKKANSYSFSGLIFRFLYKRYTYKYGIQIPPKVEIGKGFLMIHQGGIVINSRTIIGENCTILHGVTLGNTKRGKLMGAPTIGNQVYIGPGAVVVGNVKIGNNVLIAPNSYVNCDVPSDSIVIGNPCRIISDKNGSSGYINNIYLY